MRYLSAIALLLAALAIANDAWSQQRMPGRQRGESPRDEGRREREARPPALTAPEPCALLERELPSLKVDLKLTEAQVEAWNLFERDVRHVAELDRARLRQAMAQRDAAREPPTAIALMGTWADLDRRKAEGTAELVRHLTTLSGLLDEAQRRMLDRRVNLSQSEPLGR